MSKKLIKECPNCGKKLGLPSEKKIRFKCVNCQENFEFDGKNEVFKRINNNESENFKPHLDSETSSSDDLKAFIVLISAIIFGILLTNFIGNKYAPFQELYWFWQSIINIVIIVICYLITNYVVFRDYNKEPVEKEKKLENSNNSADIQHINNYDWQNYPLIILTILVCLPLFQVLENKVPKFNFFLDLDRVLMFFAINLMVYGIFILFKKTIFWLTIILGLTLLFTSYYKEYTPYNLYHDYISLINYSLNKENLIEIEKASFEKLIYNKKSREIKQKIDYKNPKVREFAQSAIHKNFKYETKKYHSNYRTIIHSFAIFKEINNHWHYVDDPMNNEYFAYASESIKYFQGDCDDYSILMAAALKVIGARVRLVRTESHIFPELYVGKENNLENILLLIQKLFSTDYHNNKIFYQKDKNGDIWLNFDYTDKYPGGRYIEETFLFYIGLDDF